MALHLMFAVPSPRMERGGTTLAPEPVVRAALRVLFIAASTTRNWTLAAAVPRERLNDLWEAIHPIPDLLCRWRADSEDELLRYLDGYDGKWPTPKLRDIYEQARSEASA
jgi:hypothetical protein